jgi:hypothetical protein
MTPRIFHPRDGFLVAIGDKTAAATIPTKGVGEAAFVRGVVAFVTA